MTLAPGSRLGPYEIVAPLGAGGMGEVYQARDGRLGRDVAIKILPEGVAAPAVFARFEREARLCSSLTHPNVVTVYELAEAEGTPYIAMELVRGESLRALLGRRLPPKRALALAAQIADGLAAAHACGIVHRDLKPENVMITPAGVAKVLDFGIARLEEDATVTEQATDVRLTREGSLLGTIAYMSPEQARGESVDFRSDQFSFGTMLFEMLTGRNPFSRGSAAASVAAILNDDPEPLDRVTGVAPHVAAIVERLLAKEPADRYASTADLAYDLRRAGTLSAPRRARGARTLLWAIPLAAVLLAGAFALGRYLDREPRTSSPPMRLAVGIVDQAVTFGETTIALAISPDGRTIVMSALDADKSQHLFAHDLVLGTTRKLEGTESGYSPAWNDEGTAVAFFAEGKLKTVPVGGGPPRVLCDASPEGKAAWSGDTIVFAQFREGPSIWRIDASGGEPRRILAPVEGKVPFWPEFLPDGKRYLFLYTVDPTKERRERTHELMLASLDDGGEPRLVARIASRAVWVDTGHLLFVRDGTLFAQEFDPDEATLNGEAKPLASGLHYFFSTGQAAFSVSQTGPLVWRAPRNEAELTWVDRRGTVLSVVGRGRFEKGHMSDDGEQYATAVIDEKLGIASLWTWDVARGNGVRISFASFDEKAPVWTPDGSLLFRTDENGPPDIHLRRPGDEKGTPLVARPGVQEPLEVSPDGRWLLFGEANRTSGGDIWIAPLDGSGEPRPYLRTPSTEWSPRFSPDGAFVAYHSNASGKTEIYARPFEGGGQPVRISSDGGSEPRWRGDGREIYYLAPDGVLMAAPVERAGATIRPGAPAPLFRAPAALDFEVTPAGDRFLIRTATGQDRPPIRLLTDWRAAIVDR